MRQWMWMCLLWAAAPATAQDHWLVHLTPDRDFVTSLILENATESPQDYALALYGTDGLLGEATGSLAAGEIRISRISELADQLGEPSHLAVLNDPELVRVTAVYRAATGSGSPAQVGVSSESARRWRLFSGDWSTVFDGFAVVNLGDAPAQLTVSRLNESGQPVQVLALDETPVPLAKVLVLLGSPAGSEFGDVPENTAFEIECDQPLLFVALRGTISEPFLLWQNAGTPLPPRLSDAEPGVVETMVGPVRGEPAGDGWAFRGIPYAKPPLGDLRWRPPQAPQPWSDTLETDAYGPPCPQLDQSDGRFFGDEDCLTLNVWTPEQPMEGARLPVMFFIHGGGNVQGSASVPAGNTFLYDGQDLAEARDHVVVTVQYRLGPLGYFAADELAAENLADGDAGVSGNYGIRDLIFALEWVQANIAAFGGDPDRVMIFGESAGARNTCILVGSPLAAGLFHAAGIQSGPCLTRSAEQVFARADALRAATGCEQADDPIACLRDLDAETLLLTLPPSVSVAGGSTAEKPYIDGHVILEEPLDAMAAGRHHAVPLIIGANADETARDIPTDLNQVQYIAIVTAIFGPLDGAQILAEYNVQTYGSAYGALVALTSDLNFICNAGDAATAAAIGQDEPVYRYLFSESVYRGNGTDFGAYHGLELFFVFGNLNLGFFDGDATEYALSAEMQDYWSGLAAAGDPNLYGTGPVWEAYDPARDDLMELNGEGSAMTENPRADACTFLDEILEQAKRNR